MSGVDLEALEARNLIAAPSLQDVAAIIAELRRLRAVEAAARVWRDAVQCEHQSPKSPGLCENCDASQSLIRALDAKEPTT